jgi:hypothetical protein
MSDHEGCRLVEAMLRDDLDASQRRQREMEQELWAARLRLRRLEPYEETLNRLAILGRVEST